MVRHVREPLVSSRPDLSSEKGGETESALGRDSEKVKREDDLRGWGGPAS